MPICIIHIYIALLLSIKTPDEKSRHVMLVILFNHYSFYYKYFWNVIE